MPNEPEIRIRSSDKDMHDFTIGPLSYEKTIYKCPHCNKEIDILTLLTAFKHGDGPFLSGKLDIQKEIAGWPTKDAEWRKIETDIRADPEFRRFSPQDQATHLMIARMKWEMMMRG